MRSLECKRNLSVSPLVVTFYSGVQSQFQYSVSLFWPDEIAAQN
jgi:hypothetical protein